MPIVSTTHCDIPGVVVHGENGLLAPERDVAALAEHLAWLDAHPERWAGMAVIGRRRVEERFDARTQGAALGVERLRGFVEASLKNTGLEALDLIQLHCPPTEVFVVSLAPKFQMPK